MNWPLLSWPGFLSRCSKRFGSVSDEELAALWRAEHTSEYLGAWFALLLHTSYGSFAVTEPGLGVLGRGFICRL